jgi:HD-GYP domain-containing protein (c-di-GMP phosphodiesterase class II)
MPAPDSGSRLAELLGALSLATDLANGLTPEHGLRVALLAARLAAADGLGASRDAYWTGLLRYLGCTAFAVEESRFAAGDDIALRASFARNDVGRFPEFARAAWRDVGRGAPPLQRWRGLVELLSSPGAPRAHALAQCDAGVHAGRRLGMDSAVLQALSATEERWDGSGLPHRLAGDALPLAQRHVEVARVAAAIGEHALATGLALDLALSTELRRRAGRHLDPALVQRFLADLPTLLPALEPGTVWDAFLDAEPGLWLVGEGQFDALCEAFAMIADLKSGYFAGHSPGVAVIAGDAATALGLSDADKGSLRRAALLHDLGVVSVPTGLWDKPGPLSAAEWERVRLHSYWTDRALRRSPALAPLADIASRAHERLDGSGYHRGDGDAMGLAPRLLAAADTYHACTEPRAWRTALSAEEAKRVLRQDARDGRLCPHAVDAVLGAVGHASARRPADAPEALSEREHEVLRLLVRGLTNKQIAKALSISPRTVQHHTIHIYAKTGVRSRAGVALWAVERRLL